MLEDAIMSKPVMTTSKRASSIQPAAFCAGKSICSWLLIISAAVVATPFAYSDDARTPDRKTERIPVSGQQKEKGDAQTSIPAQTEVSKKARRQESRPLGRTPDERPIQNLDLGLCDGN